MAYEPTVWETGDVITAEKLNKAENGIASASTVIITGTAGDQSITLNASYNDIKDLIDAGKLAIIQVENAYKMALPLDYEEADGSYYIKVAGIFAGNTELDVVEFGSGSATSDLIYPYTPG